MFVTQSNFIRNLSKKEYLILKEMCWYSNNLYNVALYNVRQHFFVEKHYLRYESNYHNCKTNENYKMLQAGVAQETLKMVDRSFKSFFALLKKAKAGQYNATVKIPHYREKNGLFNLVMSTNAINIKDGYFRVPISKSFANKYGKTVIRIPFPKHINPKSVKEVHILPINNGRCFKIQYCYEIETENINLDKNNTLAIDMGLENLATCVTNKGTSFIMDGRKIKSINQYWNKQKAYLQSIASRQKCKTTKRLQALTLKRNNRVNDYIKKTARYIVNYCISNNIGTVVYGYNPDFKRRINLGKKNNQQFTQISFGNFREALSTLCERYSMQYIEQEESYTSKASFLDLDNVPVYNPKEQAEPIFSGKRTKRGLYKSSNGRSLNADVNGACNILRKSKQNFDFEELCRGLLASPLRIRVA